MADIAKAGNIVGDAAGAPHTVAAVAFAAAFTSLCFWSPPRVLDRVNSALVVAVVASFLVSTPMLLSLPHAHSGSVFFSKSGPAQHGEAERDRVCHALQALLLEIHDDMHQAESVCGSVVRRQQRHF